MSHRRLFASLLAANLVAALIVAAGVWAPLQAAAGLLLVLILPGALVSYAVLPADPAVDWRLRSVLAAALSATTAVVAGLALALAFDQASRGAVALALGAIATVAALVATARDDGSKAVALPARPSISPAVALVTVALAIACGALAAATLEVDALPGKFTELSLTRQGNAARLVARNREGEAESYRYAVRADGRLLRTGTIEVDDGQARSLLVPIPDGARQLDGDLYLDGPRPYRSVSLQLESPGSTP